MKSKKNYFTRKNLICIALSIFYSFLIVFVGACLEGNHSLIYKKNPIALLAQSLKFQEIKCGISGGILLCLIALYFTICFATIIYEVRYATINNIKKSSPKMIFTYILTIICCLVLSFGVGIAIQGSFDAENLKLLFIYIWQTILLATLIYVCAFLLIGSIVMLITNYLLIDKPFRSFNENVIPDFKDDEFIEKDVASNFDSVDNTTINNQTLSSIVGEGVQTIAGGGTTLMSEKLDDREKVFPALSEIDVQYEGYEQDNLPTVDITLSQLCERFRNYLAKEEKLYFDIDTIRFFISGFAASHFMILEGLSGTGKSSLPRYFAKFTNANLLFIAVQATWRDKTNLIGYFNNFSNTYQETEFLESLYHANYNPDMIHIFVLDEMNISRVEYYFADFLSVLEYPKEQWKIKVMQLPFGFVPPAKLDNGIINIPQNSYFVGTANKDDSTFTITDKVYDRAITIDFDRQHEAFVVDGEASSIELSQTTFTNLLNDAKNNPKYQLNEEDYEKFRHVTDYINEQFDITFGNRILNQISQVVPTFVCCGGKKEDALDFLLSRKIISKIEGRFEEYVKDALKGLNKLLEKEYGANVFKRSETVIKKLIKRL
ncbi:MAG: hypothetical protein ACI4U5_05080 [Bacilli bacterium]